MSHVKVSFDMPEVRALCTLNYSLVSETLFSDQPFCQCY
jgi:hypothetical protein